jgi:hypothetical protein
LPLENNEYLLARPLLEIFPSRNLLKKPPKTKRMPDIFRKQTKAARF